MNSRNEQDDRETMPVFDESIFDPEAAVKALGFTDEDIEALVRYFRWFIDQGNLQAEKRKLVELLRRRRDQLVEQRRADILRELHSLQRLEFESVQEL